MKSIQPVFNYDDYIELEQKYTILQYRLVNLLQTVAQNAQVDVLGVFSRIKSYNSLIEKSARKGYPSPHDVKDICGLRIIYYQAAQLELLKNAIRYSGLDIVEEEDKAASRPVNQIGYDAYHFVVMLPGSWITGQYEMLTGLKAEVQLSTVAQHLWSNVSHRTNYKERQLDPKHERRLNLFKALLEIADDMVEQITSQLTTPEKSALTAEKLRLALDKIFPDRDRVGPESIQFVLANTLPYVGNVEEIYEYWEEWNALFPEIEKRVMQELGVNTRWREDGALKALLDLASEAHWKAYQMYMHPYEKAVLESYRKKKNHGN